MLSSAYSDRRPTDGLGSRLDRIKGRARRELWLKRVAMTPSGTRDVLNDALSIYFGNPTLASALVARWCAGYSVETVGASSKRGRMSRCHELEPCWTGHHESDGDAILPCQ